MNDETVHQLCKQAVAQVMTVSSMFFFNCKLILIIFFQIS